VAVAGLDQVGVADDLEHELPRNHLTGGPAGRAADPEQTSGGRVPSPLQLADRSIQHRQVIVCERAPHRRHQCLETHSLDAALHALHRRHARAIPDASASGKDLGAHRLAFRPEPKGSAIMRRP
jgi:hypothetical protein